MIDKQIRPAIELIPEKQSESELFIKISEMVDHETEKFSQAIIDVASKYTDPNSVSREVVSEVFRENGLPSVVELLEKLDVVDHNTLLAFSSYILLFKGSRSGYETVLRLMGFDYDMTEWWEVGGSGVPNTFAINIDLNDSRVSQPYETFQKIKKFTSEYVFPIIFPLGYTYVIDFKGPSIAVHGAVQQTLFSYAEDAADADLMYGPSNWVVSDGEGQNWVIKVGRLGTLKAFPVDREPGIFISLVSDNGDLFNPRVSPAGAVTFEAATVLSDRRDFVQMMDYQKRNWILYVTGAGNLVIGNVLVISDKLLTESFLPLLQENGSIIVL